MKYSKGSIGRIFLLKFEDGDIVIDELKKISKKEKVLSAVVLFMGALKKGHIVTGPKKAIIPPEPNWSSFRDGWETLGIATIFSNRSGPQVHVHAAMGKGGRTITGCVRKNSEVFLVIEAVVFEIKGTGATKDLDPATGLNLLKIR